MKPSRGMMLALTGIAAALAAAPARAQTVEGRKWPNPPLPGESRVPPGRLAETVRLSADDFREWLDDRDEPVDAPAETPADSDLEGYAELLPYVLPSPGQGEAGSCLYMATTGAAEYWLARLDPELSRGPDGPADLSERFAMNAVHWIPGLASKIGHWLTDSIEIFNTPSGALLNRDYRFTMGWYEIRGGKHRPSAEENPGAYYGTGFNWIPASPKLGGDVPALPEFDREVLFEDPERNRWAVNTAPADAVERVKAALTERQAPVLVTYNHYGIWHAVLVVGFNDDAPTRGCAFTSEFPSEMRSAARRLELQAQKTADPFLKLRLLRKARYYRDQAGSVETALKAEGGCRDKGMFFVRDSIYPDREGPLYDYDPDNWGEEEPYSARVVLREYAWLERLSNHAVEIRAVPRR